MRTLRRFLLATILLVLVGLPGLDAQTTDAGGKAAARSALEAFISAWNTADNVELRKTMNFPFVSLFGGGAIVAQEPDDFSTDYAAMRQRNDWVRSAFDFETLQILASSDAKVHCAIDFQRFNSGGVPYMRGRVFYIFTRQDGHWGLQVRTGFPGASMAEEASAEALQGARQAVLDFFTAFNAGDVDGVSQPLNYPHVFLAGGGVRAAPDAASPSVRPNFERMREAQGWHRSSIESLEASHVSENKVHFDLVFSRWHPDGSRYLTIPALWILTRAGDHWGIQLRSLMPPTFSSQ
jgi:ketosteroid isomerase-like protein